MTEKRRPGEKRGDEEGKEEGSPRGGEWKKQVRRGDRKRGDEIRTQDKER